MNTKAGDRPATANSHSERRLHHVGVVVRDIEAEIDGFARSIGGGHWKGRIFHDPLQKVKVTFIESTTAGEPQIELVEPAADDSPVWVFLRAGGGLHHLCYEVDDLDSYLCELRKAGSKTIRPPLPAVAFDGRRIAWVVTRAKVLLELLERLPVQSGLHAGVGQAI